MIPQGVSRYTDYRTLCRKTQARLTFDSLEAQKVPYLIDS